MEYEPTNIISRIHWCRHQQQLHMLTREERAGWRAEEEGLKDALFGRQRTASLRESPPSQLARYQIGFEDGMALLRFSTSTPWGMTGTEKSDTIPLTTQDWADGRPVQRVPPVHVASRP